MISYEQALTKLSKRLGISKTFLRKVMNETFGELENVIKNEDNFMFKGYVKFVQSKNNKKPISKTELFNLKTKDK
jgi:nucleoid DNA-binding protein